MSNLNDKFLNKSCKVIHKMVVDKWSTLPLSLYPFEEDYIDYYNQIFDFISKTLSIDDIEDVNEIFYYFVWNYNEDGDYTNTETPDISEDDLKDMFDDYGLVLSDFFRVSPFTVKKMAYPHYEMPVFYVGKENEWYAIGKDKQVNVSIRIFSEERWASEDEVWEILGVEEYLNYVEVSDSNKRMIASEESSHYESEMGEDEVIDYLRDNMWHSEEAKKLVELYDEVAEIWGELPSSEDGTEYTNKMEDIVEEGRETVRELYYDYVYERLDDNQELVDYLWEMGYISKTNNRWKIEGGLPKWLSFDWEKFHDYDVDHIDVSELSPYGDYDTFKYKDDIYYYIFRVDY